MTHDPVASGKTIWKGRAFNAPALIVLALVFAGFYWTFAGEFGILVKITAPPVRQG